MATLKEIAKKIDVSITTVSRVLNNDTSLSVSDDIRKRIIKTAAKMDYKTPRNRVRLKSSNRLMIAIIHWYSIEDEFVDPYYIQLRKGIEQLSIKSNINTVLIYKDEGEYNLDTIEGVNGIICLGKFAREHINTFEKITDNIVFVDSSPNEEKFDSVVIDFNSAVRDTLGTIINKGYKKIGYIGGIEHVSKSVRLGEKRELVYRDYLYQKGLLNTKFIHIGKFSSESGYKLMKEALNGKTRANIYFCANDSIALGALRAAKRRTLKKFRYSLVISYSGN